MDKCKVKNYINEYGKWPLLYHSFDENIELFIDNNKNNFIEFDLKKNCGAICGHNTDCDKEYFNLSADKLKANRCQKQISFYDFSTKYFKPNHYSFA